MDGHQREEWQKLNEKLENLEKQTQQMVKNIEECGETVEYLKDLIYRYLNLTEKSKKTESMLINILFTTVGFLLGFALALLIFKS